jgi:hypothetical protein
MNVVALFVLAIVVLVVAMMGGLVLALVLSLRSLSRRNRVSPGQPTQAPTLWLWSMGHAARSHRRLQRVAAAARAAQAAAGVTGEQIADLAVDLERQACALDDQIVLATRFSTANRVRRMYQLDHPVKELETLAVRVTILAGHFSAHAPMAAQPLAERVHVMEQAVAEVRRIEAEARAEVDALSPASLLPAPGTPWSPPPARTPTPAVPVSRRAGPPPGSTWPDSGLGYGPPEGSFPGY